MCLGELSFILFRFEEGDEMIKILTSGDSHGYGLFGIVEGVPAHFEIDVSKIDEALFLRQHVYGRGKRMSLESDHVQVLSGLWQGKTTGAPLTFFIKNKSTTPPNEESSVPRPGHADFAGMVKYLFQDSRITTERASSRRTAMDVAIGEVFRQALEKLKIKVWSYTVEVGEVRANVDGVFQNLSLKDHPLLCPESKAEKKMMIEIDRAFTQGYTLGGKVKTFVEGLPIGIGTFNSYENRITSVLARALFDIPSVRGVEFGDIEKTYVLPGIQYMDEIETKGVRATNHAGGIEGGMANGERIEIVLFVKAVPTQRKSLKSIDMKDGKEARTSYVRSDTCVVGAISVISTAKVSTAIFRELIEEFGSSTFSELEERVEDYRRKRVIPQ